MNKNITTVSATEQNAPVPTTENVENQMEFVELPIPSFKITTITKRVARLINTGNYQNTTIETAITAEVEENNIQQVADILEQMIAEDLNQQEKSIRDNLLAVEEEKKQEEIKQSEAIAAKMKKINLYKWLISNQYGDQVAVSNDVHYQMTCPRCGGKLEKKNGKSGPFYGCGNYHTNNCRFTISHNQVYDFLNRVVEYLETNKVQHPERIYGYITNQNSVEIDFSHATEEDNQPQIPVQQVQQPQVHQGQIPQQPVNYQNRQPIQQYVSIPNQNNVGYQEDDLPF